MPCQNQHQSIASNSTINFHHRHPYPSYQPPHSGPSIQHPYPQAFSIKTSPLTHLSTKKRNEVHQTPKTLALLPLAAQVHGNCNAGGLAGGLAGAIPTTVGLTAGQYSGCAAATVASFVLPFLAPVAMICWGLVVLETAVIVGGTVGLAQLGAGGGVR